MSLLGALRAGWSRYRKRKTLPLDGAVGGLDSSASHVPYQSSYIARPRIDQPHDHQDYAPQHKDDYDPHPGLMDLAPLTYEPDYAEMPSPRRPLAPNPVPHTDSSLWHTRIMPARRSTSSCVSHRASSRRRPA